MGRRVLVFSSIGHALMHMMTAFYAVIVLTLAVDLGPAARAPAGALCAVGHPARRHVPAGRLGIGPLRRAADDGGDVRRPRPVVDRLRPGRHGRHLRADAGAVRPRRVRRHLPLGRHRLDHPHRQGAGPRHGRERPVGQRRAGALRHRAGRADHARLVARRLHRAGHRLRRGRRGARLADPAGQGRRPADARDGRRADRQARVLARLLRALRHHGARRHRLGGRDVRRRPGLRDAARRRHRGPARAAGIVGRWPRRSCCGSVSRPR